MLLELLQKLPPELSQQLNSIYKHSYVRPPSFQLFIDHPVEKLVSFRSTHHSHYCRLFIPGCYQESPPLSFFGLNLATLLWLPPRSFHYLWTFCSHLSFLSFVLITVRSPRTLIYAPTTSFQPSAGTRSGHGPIIYPSWSNSLPPPFSWSISSPILYFPTSCIDRPGSGPSWLYLIELVSYLAFIPRWHWNPSSVHYSPNFVFLLKRWFIEAFGTFPRANRNNNEAGNTT